MIKKIFVGVGITTIIALICININISLFNGNASINLTMENIEALAEELGMDNNCYRDYWGSEAQKVPCEHNKGNGWFTGSVKRICKPHPDSSLKCTPVACGEIC